MSHLLGIFVRLCSSVPRVARVGVVTSAVVVGSVVAPATAPSTGAALSGAPTVGEGVDGVLPLEPYRLVDTRLDESRLDAGEVRFVPVAGRGGVPATASAVNVNVTAVRPGARGFFTVWPCASAGEQPPTASMVNFVEAQNRANAGVLGVGSTGGLCVYTLVAADLVIDVMGYSIGDSGVTPLAPYRRFDTRQQGVPMPSGGVERIRFTGFGGVPVGADSVFANITTTGSVDVGFVTVWPCDSATDAPPTASVSNYRPGVAIASNALVALADDGAACVFVRSATHLIIDVTASVSSKSPVQALPPTRVLDTRVELDNLWSALFWNCRSLPGLAGCRVTNSPYAAFFSGEAGVDVSVVHGVPVDAVAVLVTVTAVARGWQGGYMTVWPYGDDIPTASVLNYRADEVVPNTVLVGLRDGRFDLYVNSQTDVLVDVVGYVSSPTDWPWGVDFSTIDDLSGTYVYGVRLCDVSSSAAGPAFTGPTGGPLTATDLVRALNSSARVDERIRTAFVGQIDIVFEVASAEPCGMSMPGLGEGVIEQDSANRNDEAAGRGALGGGSIGMYVPPFDQNGQLTDWWIDVFLHEFGHNLGFDHANFNYHEYASGLDFMGALTADRLHVQRLVAVGAVDEQNVQLHVDGTTTLALTALPVHTGTMPGPTDTLAVAVPSLNGGSHPMRPHNVVMLIEPVVSSVSGACDRHLDRCDGVVVSFADGHAFGRVALDPTYSFGATPHGEFQGRNYLVGAAVLEPGTSTEIGGVTISVVRRDADDRIVVTISGSFDEAVPVAGVVMNPWAVVPL